MIGVRLSYRQIMVGRTMVGMVGMNEVFGSLASELGEADMPDLGARLVTEVQEHNYVPRGAAAEYEKALLREYRAYLEARRSGTAERAWRDPQRAQALVSPHLCGKVRWLRQVCAGLPQPRAGLGFAACQGVGVGAL
jgi:hypothetical protein